MADAIRANDIQKWIDEKASRRQKKEKVERLGQAREEAEAVFDGKAFNSLSSSEKDDLLKVLAIMAGIIEE